jgi:NTP pyrophosphatase (non-canonical NTP hydrolase)
MKISELQDQAAKVFLGNLKRDNIEVSDDYLVLKLTEELGEFVQAYLIDKKHCRPVKYLPAAVSRRELAKELSDVLGIILVIAKKSKIDIEEALVKKWITKEWLKK